MKIRTRKFKNKDLIRLIKQAANFYADQLFPDKKFKVYLEINASDIKPDGYCSQLSNHDFEIEINKNLTFEHMMITLAHEMVHIKQYVNKELKSKYVKGKCIDTWKGVKYKDLNYVDQPWEIEAARIEEELYHMLLIYNLLCGRLDFTAIKQIDQRNKEHYAT